MGIVTPKQIDLENMMRGADPRFTLSSENAEVLDGDNETLEKIIEADGAYQAGLAHVKNTPEPNGQKFKIGSRVSINESKNDFGHSRKNATVEYTYAHAYGGGGERINQYSLVIDGIGSVAWFYAEQLTELNC